MSKNQLVYTMQVSHYSRILNRKQPVMTMREKQLSDAINIQVDIEQSMLVRTILDIFKSYDLFDGNRHEKHPHVFHLHGLLASVMTHLMPTQLVKTDRVVVMRSSQIDEEGEGFLQSKNTSNIVLKQHDSDRMYIERCFGRSIYSNQKLNLLENNIEILNMSFVRQIETNTKTRSIIRFIIEMAHTMDIKIIAEGAETKEQVEFLRDNGCDYIQGYYFGRPMQCYQFEEKYVNGNPDL